MIAGYVKILHDTGVTGYPFIQATRGGKPAELRTPISARVDNHKLLAMNAYLASLRAPRGVVGDGASVDRGR